MSKYYNHSEIQELMNKEISIQFNQFRKTIINYIQASNLFNDKYKNKYKIRLFREPDFLNIFLDNLQNEKSFKVQILNKEINYLSVEDVLKAYEELIKKLY